MKWVIKRFSFLLAFLAFGLILAQPLYAQALRGEYVQIELLSQTTRNAATFNGSTISRMHNFKEAVLILNMVSATGDILDTFNLRLQHSPDNGTSWVDFGSFLTHTGNTAASQVLQWSTIGPVTGVVQLLSVLNRNLAAGTVQAGPVGSLWRVVGDLVGSTSARNIGVTGFFKR